MNLAELSKLGIKDPFKKRYDNYIGGKWVPPVGGDYFDNVSPINGQPFCRVPRSNAADIDLAINAAHAARKDVVAANGGTWREGAERDMLGMSSKEWPVYLVEQLGTTYPAFAALADRRGVTPQQVALAWVIAQSPSIIAIVGSSRPSTIRDSALAVELKLDAKELATLSAVGITSGHNSGHNRHTGVAGS